MRNVWPLLQIPLSMLAWSSVLDEIRIIFQPSRISEEILIIFFGDDQLPCGQFKILKFTP